MLTQTFQVSERRACKVVDQNRSSQRKVVKGKKDDSELKQLVKSLAKSYPGYGYRRMKMLLHELGHKMNHKKVLRVWRELGLVVKRR